MEITNTTIIIATKDNDVAMGKFYTDLLGFVPNEHGGYDGGGISVFFDRHNKASVKSPEPFRVMLTFAVPNLDESYNELKSKGVVFVREPSAEEWGGRFATFIDPDGNYLQLFESGKS